jgi:indoleamine 2,3-dioxygenase
LTRLQWLPNQLFAVLDQMTEVKDKCSDEAGVDEIVGLVELQRVTLGKEVERYCRERGV